jgi:hypothetical protein
MTEIAVPKFHHVGTSIAEMPQDGHRYRFVIEKYRHDDGTEWGQIVSMEEIPDAGLYMWVPSWGARDAREAQYLADEFAYEREHPHPQDVEQLGQHREYMRRQRVLYDELRDKRAEIVKRHPVTLGGR